LLLLYAIIQQLTFITSSCQSLCSTNGWLRTRRINWYEFDSIEHSRFISRNIPTSPFFINHVGPAILCGTFWIFILLLLTNCRWFICEKYIKFIRYRVTSSFNQLICDVGAVASLVHLSQYICTAKKKSCQVLKRFIWRQRVMCLGV
jgi:hypothetical protein